MAGKAAKKEEKRSKSADTNRWSAVNNRLQSVQSAVSRSLPNMVKREAKIVVENQETKKKRRKKKKDEEQETVLIPQEPPRPKIVINQEDKRKKTLWRHATWLIILFAYSLLGGLIFSAIEGGHDRSVLIGDYERRMDVWRRRRVYQQKLFQRFREIDNDQSIAYNRKGLAPEQYKLLLVKDALSWYERKLGVVLEQPIMTDTKWNLWGGVYYAASLYTTIGYGNFHPKTTSGRIVSMLYAFIGIPLVFTILFDWGFLYFTWIEYGWNWLNQRFCQGVRRVGSELSLRSMSTIPLLSVHRTTSAQNAVNTIDHQIESNNPLRALELCLPEQEQAQTVPMKAALLFFIFWISLAAFIVRLWEYEWTYFMAFYFFFTSLTTIGLGDVVTKTPNFIIFNLALTLVGLSVVGLCVAIVQAKVKLVFDRMIRSIDSQYRIRQIDPDVATMTIVPDENEGVKRLIEAQPIQDRIVFLFMDEHKMSMLRERWRLKSSMVNRITQTYPSRADKYVQTGNRVYDQPINSDGEYDSEYDEDEDEEEEEPEIPSARRYIYTVFD